MGGGRRGLAWLLRALVVVAVLAAGLLNPLSAANRQHDTAAITRMVVAMRLSADGTLTSRETLDVLMPYGKHGIFRIFDTADPRRLGITHDPEHVVVTRNGQPEPWTWSGQTKGTKTLRIGSPDVVLEPGTYRYTIDSQVTKAIEPGSGDRAVWWWNVVGSGWQMPIGEADVIARLPAAPQKTECVQSKDTPCTVSVSGRTLRVRTGPLAPFTPVTVRATFPPGALPAPPAGESWLRYWWPSLAALLAGLLGAFLLVRRTREVAPGFPVLFEPPAGISPALGAYVVSEDHAHDDLQATLYDLAQRGLIKLEGRDSGWNIEGLKAPSETEVTPAEQRVLGLLGVANQGDSFAVEKSEQAGLVVKHARDALRGNTAVEAATYLTPSPAGIAVRWLGLIAFAATLAQGGIYLFSQSGWRSWPLLLLCAGFALVALGAALDPATRSVHGAAGRELWSRAGGFRRFLSTDSSESRFAAAEKMDLYPRYLPWAVAFGVADAWAARYKAQGVEPPTVPWLLWYGSPTHTSSFADLSKSFSGSISAASTAYAAAQATSAAGSIMSSGGGGFGGGSGGGGGGGGSW